MTTAINSAVEKGDAAIGAHLVRDVSLPALVLHRDAWNTTFAGCRHSSATAGRSWRPTARPA